MGQHLTKMQSQYPNLLCPVSLPCPQLDRAALQQDQTVSESRHSLQQARGQLPRIRPACINKAVAEALMSTRPKCDPDYSYTLTCANSGVEQLHRLLADGEP